MKHTFVICAYKESPFLEECVQSLLAQTYKSEIIMATSTPNQLIRQTCQKYNIPLFINEGGKGITQDWNFAYSQTDTEYLTIAHQDDIYSPDYTESILKGLQNRPDALIAFTDYGELRGSQKISLNTNLRIKKILLMPLRIRGFQNKKIVKRAVLSLGNPICCPAVTFSKKLLPDPIFRNHFRSNEDWEAWEKLSKKKGSFVYIKGIHMYHRIHGGSETSAIIGDRQRSNEDYEMFRHFWPDFIAKVLTKAYSASEESNKL